MWAKGIGSSVTNSTLSRDALAKSSRSLKSSAQYWRTLRPSTLLRSPPKIHCLPGLLSTKGYKKIKSRRQIGF